MIEELLYVAAMVDFVKHFKAVARLGSIAVSVLSPLD